MNVMRILTGKLKDGDKLFTPVRKKVFVVERRSEKEVILKIGKGWKTPLPANCLDGIPNFLKGKGWVEIGAIHSMTSKPGTLEDYLNKSKSQKRSTASYVAVILEHAEIVEIDRKKPIKVRLSNSKVT